MQKRKTMIKGFTMFEIIIIIVITSVVSAITVGVIFSNNYRTSTGVSYQYLLEDENVKEFLDVYSKVLDEYYEDIDKKEVINGAINGMMSYFGDKYSTYMDSDSTDSLTSSLSGIYHGVGISIDSKGNIVEILDNSPASESGLQVKDLIVKINDTDIDKSNVSKISSLIKESENDIVKIKVKRNEQYYEYEIKVGDLYVPAITTETYDYKDKKVGYVFIASFSATLGDQLKTAIEKMDGNIDALIIDVRSNNGGYLKAATDSVSLFVEKGKVIYSLEAKNGSQSYYDETDDKRDYPIAVLVDDGTASAAEILAAALKDSYGASIVGVTTYGKGKVQSTYKLDNGSMVKYTSAKWFRPNGECIDEIGITPDYYVELEAEEGGFTYDSQFNEAIEVVTSN